MRVAEHDGESDETEVAEYGHFYCNRMGIPGVTAYRPPGPDGIRMDTGSSTGDYLAMGNSGVTLMGPEASPFGQGMLTLRL